MSVRVLRWIAPLLFLAAALSPPGGIPTAAAEPRSDLVVRPGMAWHRTHRHVCTLAFLFRARGNTYAATAGHCFSDFTPANPGGGPRQVFEDVYASGNGPAAYLGTFREDLNEPLGPRIGTVVYAASRPPEAELTGGAEDLPPFMDLALILLDGDVRPEPAVCLYGGPTGLNRDVSGIPAAVRVYGAGEPFGYEHFTKTTMVPGRTGAAVVPAHTHIVPLVPLSPGDSGAPIVDASGRALATVTEADYSPRLGPGLERAERILGLRLRLLTAPNEEAAAFGRDTACVP